MNISLDENVDSANTIKLNLSVLVVTPVSHFAHVVTSGIKLGITYAIMRLVKGYTGKDLVVRTFGNNGVLGQAAGQLTTLVGLDPGIVVN